MLIDNIVIITGGAGRIGSAISRKIIECGGRVVLVDVDEKKINLLEKEFGSDLCLALNIDVGNEEGSNLVIEKAILKFGHIDSVIHSAYPCSPQWGNKFEDIKQKYLYQDLSSQIGDSILFSQKGFANSDDMLELEKDLVLIIIKIIKKKTFFII